LVVFCEVFQAGAVLSYRLSLLDYLRELSCPKLLWYHARTAVGRYDAVRYVLPWKAVVGSLVWLYVVGAYCLDVFDGRIRPLWYCWLYQL
jgi:hypothetical protein